MYDFIMLLYLSSGGPDSVCLILLVYKFSHQEFGIDNYFSQI